MKLKLSDKELLDIYRYMLLSRRFNELFVKLYYNGKALECPHSEIGQEAIGVGACYNLRKDDYVVPSLRTRSAFIVRGVPIQEQMAGIYGKATGPARGKVSTHHMGDHEKGVIGTTGIVGGHIPISTGVALACKLRKMNSVVLCFFGDGASNKGDFHEALNFAAVRRLPVLFIVENNQYAEYTPIGAHMAITNIADRAHAYGFPGVVVNGNDVLAVYEATQEAIARARTGEGPTLLECKTYRLRRHCEGAGGQDADGRPKEEIETWKKKDAIPRFEKWLLERGVLNESLINKMEEEIASQLGDAIRFAEDSPWPELEEIVKDVYGPEEPFAKPALRELEASAKEISIGKALNEALREELMRDENVFLMGEDIGAEATVPLTRARGCIWPPTGNLCMEFPERIINTPISESEIVGAAVGAALVGMRPVVEIMYADFLGIAMDQLVNSAAKMRYNYGGEACVPLVVRTAFGAGTSEGLHHCQSSEAWILNVPGLKVVMPSTPYDAKGLLKASIRDNDPVVFFEHKMLYAVKGQVPDGDYVIPVGKADVKKEGIDVTMVATALMVHKALSAAEKLFKEAISVEVVDPRTLRPLDKETILNSVKKTGRLIVVHEASTVGGFSAEVAATVAGEALDYLDAPIIRIGAPEAPVPFSKPLERAYVPDEDKIINAVHRVLK